MLDNVLDVTVLAAAAARREEAHNKRRIGLGFTGLGDALVMLGLRYDTRAGARGRGAHRRGACATRRTAPRSTWRARRGAFPLFNADLLSAAAARFASRLPARAASERIRAHGLRNSHLLSIAPTGTISLAFADNASNGIEPRVLVDLRAQEAHGRRHLQGVSRSRTTRGGCTVT